MIKILALFIALSASAFSLNASATECWTAAQWNYCMNNTNQNDTLCGLCEAAETSSVDCAGLITNPSNLNRFATMQTNKMKNEAIKNSGKWTCSIHSK